MELNASPGQEEKIKRRARKKATPFLGMDLPNVESARPIGNFDQPFLPSLPSV